MWFAFFVPHIHTPQDNNSQDQESERLSQDETCHKTSILLITGGTKFILAETKMTSRIHFIRYKSVASTN